MSNPYVDKKLVVDVTLHPHQMGNNANDNIKNNLIATHSGKCFKSIGHITTIYGIVGEPLGGDIRPEDPKCAAVYKVTFECRLCNPLEDKLYVGKITGISPNLMLVEIGPIELLIASHNVNKHNIIYAHSKSAYFPRAENGDVLINKPINVGSYIVAKILSKKIVNGSDGILAIGTAERLATEAEVKRSIQYEFGQNKQNTENNDDTSTSEKIIDTTMVDDVTSDLL